MRIIASNNMPLDFCPNCVPCKETAEKHFGEVGLGPDGRGNCFAYDVERPSYDDVDAKECAVCGEALTEELMEEEGHVEHQYTFNISLTGYGSTLKEAWANAIEAGDLDQFPFDMIDDWDCDEMNDVEVHD